MILFYINHFSLIIFYYSVWLGFELFGLRVQVYSQLEQFTLARKGYDNDHCHNKLPGRKWGWRMDDIMPGIDGPENLRILKKRFFFLETTNTASTARQRGMGQHLTDFMIENRLACHNTNYQKREGKLWTYTYANNTKAQIDYVLINKKWKNSAMNNEAYSSFEGVSTDHRIVTAKIRRSLRKNAKRTATTKHYDWALLNSRDIRDKYVLE